MSIDIQTRLKVKIPKFRVSSEYNQEDLLAKFRYGETHPWAFQVDGEMQVANGGMVEYIKTSE